MLYDKFTLFIVVILIIVLFILFYQYVIKDKILQWYYKSQIEKVPKHIGIIADGNGRWAKNKGQPRTYGHNIGESVKLNIEVLTFFVFSTENWKRPQKEIDYIFQLLDDKLTSILNSSCKNYDDLQGSLRNDYCKKSESIYQNVSLKFVGHRNRLPLNIVKKMEQIELQNKQKKTPKITVVFAIDYGGHEEILSAIKNMIKNEDISKDTIKNINKSSLDKYMDLNKNIWPDPDLIIRTSGECRLSGFLTWHTAYSELYFTSTYWPDFSIVDFVKAIAWYSRRNRRFGNIS
jgi:undecaprenyl diphosphate synthase